MFSQNSKAWKRIFNANAAQRPPVSRCIDADERLTKFSFNLRRHKTDRQVRANMNKSFDVWGLKGSKTLHNF